MLEHNNNSGLRLLTPSNKVYYSQDLISLKLYHIDAISDTFKDIGRQTVNKMCELAVFKNVFLHSHTITLPIIWEAACIGSVPPKYCTYNKF